MTDLFDKRNDRLTPLERVISDLSIKRISRAQFNANAKQGDYAGGLRRHLQGYVDMQFGALK